MDSAYASRSLPAAGPQSAPGDDGGPDDDRARGCGDRAHSCFSHAAPGRPPRGRGCIAAVKGWYTPVPSPPGNKHAGPPGPRPRYCNGRLSKRAFLLGHCLVGTLLLFAILAPIMYAVVIPAVVRDRFANADLSQLLVHRVDVDRYTATGLEYSVSVELPPQMSFPVTASLGAMTARVETEDAAVLVDVECPPLKDVTLSQQLKISMEGSVNFNHIESISNLVREYSSGQFKERNLYVRTGLTISM
ncbi:MAG: hypothetical protein BJ554DRAFT_2779, partial [Olpidium bornovanus]